MGTKLEKITHFSTYIAPLFPVTHAHSTAKPVIDLRKWTIIFRYPEVVHPAADILRELLHTVRHGDEPASAGKPFYPALELTEGFIRPPDLCSFEREAQKVGSIRVCHLAFIPVDLELEFACLRDVLQIISLSALGL